jgi:Phytanoyl-CoA dioxygenase (PhyH)
LEQGTAKPVALKDPQRYFAEIARLTEENEAQRDPELERRILKLRHRAGVALARDGSSTPRYPEPDFASLPDGDLPEVGPADVTPELLRAAILRSGALLVRNLVEPDEAARLAQEIDRAFAAREAHIAGEESNDGYYREFVADPPFALTERGWVTSASGIWAADSPAVLLDTLNTFEQAGLMKLATGYLGERPAISVNKCTLRRVRPDISGHGQALGWHQDGAFLGDVRALNVWLSLSRCGDVAPGLDIVPRRLDHIAPTGTEGAAFDWSVSQSVAEEAAGDAAIRRPVFEPGDVMLFDELFLHATAADDKMRNTRYAVESWFFGPSAFPEGYAPMAF